MVCTMLNTNFSVSICVYGKDNPIWFKNAVNSILEQTQCPNEVVLVVDGPVTEELNLIISDFEKNEIFRIIRFKENQGHGNARRAGLNACTNELVAIMDADDISEPTRFEKQLNIFSQFPETTIVGSNIAEFVDTPRNIVGLRTVETSDAGIKKDMKKRCPMNLVTVMFKKSSIEAAGGFIDWFCEEDYYLWIRMAQLNMKFANIPEVLVNVRVGNEMYRRRGGWKYFKSEAKLQNYMLRNKIIGILQYTLNTTKRFVVQVLMPNAVRGWVFKKFARTKAQ